MDGIGEHDSTLITTVAPFYYIIHHYAAPCDIARHLHYKQKEVRPCPEMYSNDHVSQELTSGGWSYLVHRPSTAKALGVSRHKECPMPACLPRRASSFPDLGIEESCWHLSRRLPALLAAALHDSIRPGSSGFVVKRRSYSQHPSRLYVQT